MKAALLFVSLALCGCASGGGGSGGSGPSTTPAPQSARASSEPAPCGTINGRPVQCVPSMRRIIDEEMARSEGELRATYERWYGTNSSTSAPQPKTDYVRMDFYYESNTLKPHSAEYSARMGTPIDYQVEGTGFEYQQFGMWEEDIGTVRRDLTVWSYGEITPGSAVPTSGSASFTGRLVGVYVSPAGASAGAAASVGVDADFTKRSLGFASSGTTVGGAAAPQLDLRGALTYGAGQSRFSGSVANASGSLRGSSTGNFYGPRAEELGGTFSASGSGSERFVGAYGAKR